jgi:hypothetical protein
MITSIQPLILIMLRSYFFTEGQLNALFSERTNIKKDDRREGAKRKTWGKVLLYFCLIQR